MKYDPEKAECTVTLTQSGFENQKEASYFLLACPILKYT